MLQELFLVQLAAFLAQHASSSSGLAEEGVQVTELQTLRAALEVLPYDLTPSQQQVLREVVRDLRGPGVTMRLMQGDVGCGKTVVALLAMMAAAGSGERREQRVCSCKQRFCPVSKGACRRVTMWIRDRQNEYCKIQYEVVPCGLLVSVFAMWCCARQQRWGHARSKNISTCPCSGDSVLCDTDWACWQMY
jgi:hypothetical protein